MLSVTTTIAHFTKKQVKSVHKYKITYEECRLNKPGIRKWPTSMESGVPR